MSWWIHGKIGCIWRWSWWRQIVEVFRNDPYFKGITSERRGGREGRRERMGIRTWVTESCWEPRKGENSGNKMHNAKCHWCLCWRQATERLIATLKYFFFHWWYDPKPTLKAFGSKWVESTILRIRWWKEGKSGDVHWRQSERLE